MFDRSAVLSHAPLLDTQRSPVAHWSSAAHVVGCFFECFFFVLHRGWGRCRYDALSMSQRLGHLKDSLASQVGSRRQPANGIVCIEERMWPGTVMERAHGGAAAGSVPGLRGRWYKPANFAPLGHFCQPWLALCPPMSWVCYEAVFRRDSGDCHLVGCPIDEAFEDFVPFGGVLPLCNGVCVCVGGAGGRRAASRHKDRRHGG